MSSVESTARSVRITGIFARLASCSTVSQPVSTTGEKAMTSTRCAMNERIALIWFSCFCCASENFRSMPAAAAASWIDLVLAVRQPLSAPTWAKPMVRVSAAAPLAGAAVPPPPPEEPHAARPTVRSAVAAATVTRAMRDVFIDDVLRREETGAERRRWRAGRLVPGVTWGTPTDVRKLLA